jgi:hypothetical protein
MRKFLIAAVSAATIIGVPTAAFAAKPVHPTTPASANASANAHGATGVTGATGATGVTHPAKPPTVMFVLRGTLSNYTAATSSTSGSISITVKKSNFEQKSLKSLTLTFTANSKTNVVLHNGKAIANGDRGIVKVRAPKNSSATTLQTETAFQVIDQGASS